MSRAGVRRSMLVVGLLTIAVDCGGDKATGPDTTIASVTLTLPSPTMKVGAVAQATAQAFTATNTPVQGTFTYSSTDTKVADVSATGSVRALGVGTAVILATTGQVAGTATVTVVAGNPASVTKLTGDNQTGTVQAAVGTAPAVIVRDSLGNVVPGATVTFAVGTGGGAITGATATTTAAGVATVGSWTLGAAAGANTLVASVSGGTSTISATFTATGVLPVPVKLAVPVPTPNATAAVVLNPQPSVQVQSASGSVVTAATNAITVSASGGARLTGTTTVNAVNGIAKFTDLAILDAGPVTLTFSSPGLTPVDMAVTVAQGVSLVGAPVSFTLARGDPDPDTKLIPITSTGTGIVTGLSAVTTYDANGSDWLTVSLVEAKTPTYLAISLHAGALLPGTHVAQVTIKGTGAVPVTIPITLIITALPVTDLVLTQQPVGGARGEILSVSPVIELRDSLHLLATQATNAVTVRIRNGPAGAVLSGTTTVNAVGGVVTFSDLSLSLPGTYFLAFESDGANGAQSAPISITLSYGLSITAFPTTGAAGATLGQFSVRLTDRSGSSVTSENIRVFAQCSGLNGAAGTLSGTIGVNTVSGVAQFNDLSISDPGTYVCTFTADGLRSAQVTVTIN